MIRLPRSPNPDRWSRPAIEQNERLDSREDDATRDDRASHTPTSSRDALPLVSQFCLVSAEGGFPEKLTVPYGELASFSPGGNRLADITKI